MIHQLAHHIFGIHASITSISEMSQSSHIITVLMVDVITHFHIRTDESRAKIKSLPNIRIVVIDSLVLISQ